MIITRRSFLTGLLAAPLIIRAGLLMPVRPLPEPVRQLVDAGFVGTNVSRDLVIHVRGVDMYGDAMVETLRPGAPGQKMFKHISRIVHVNAAGETVVLL